MPDELPNIPRAPLDRASSDVLYNQFVTGFEQTRDKFARYFQAYPSGRFPLIPEIFFATVQTQGPNGESDFTDPRYYLVRAQTDTTLDYDKTGTGKDVYAVKDEDLFGPQIGPNLIATNLAELPKSPGNGFRHSLKSDTPVLVVAIRSKANPVQKYYVFSQQPPAGVFKVNLTQTSGGTSAPVYTVTDWNGNQLGTSMSPEQTLRFGNTIAADAGLGYYDETGTFFLLYAFENSNTRTCP